MQTLEPFSTFSPPLASFSLSFSFLFIGSVWQLYKKTLNKSDDKAYYYTIKKKSIKSQEKVKEKSSWYKPAYEDQLPFY